MPAYPDSIIGISGQKAAGKSSLAKAIAQEATATSSLLFDVVERLEAEYRSIFGPQAVAPDRIMLANFAGVLQEERGNDFVVSCALRAAKRAGAGLLIIDGVAHQADAEAIGKGDGLLVYVGSRNEHRLERLGARNGAGSKTMASEELQKEEDATLWHGFGAVCLRAVHQASNETVFNPNFSTHPQLPNLHRDDAERNLTRIARHVIYQGGVLGQQLLAAG